MTFTTKNFLASASTLGLATVLALPGIASADFINFYDITNPGTVGLLGNTQSFGGGAITAVGSQANGNLNPLTVANFSYPEPNELGLGVCGKKEGVDLCGVTAGLDQETSLWNGDITELDRLGNNERITLQANNGLAFDGTFLLASLEFKDSDNFDSGLVKVRNGATLTTLARFKRTSAGAWATGATIEQAGSEFGSNVFLLTLTNPTNLTEVIFLAGTGDSDNTKDYLVAGAGVVPIPAAAWLFGSALVGLAGLARRKGAKAGLTA